MPRSDLGQEITFASVYDPDFNYVRYKWITARKDDTVRKICGRLGHPDLVRLICKLNGIRDGTRTLTQGRRIKVPGEATPTLTFSCLAGDQPPMPTGGYAKFETVDVPGQMGLTKFDGYDPIPISVPIRFEAFMDGDGAALEEDIRTLERMAGRGNYGGAASGPPALVRVSTTNNQGFVVPLIPLPLQWSSTSQHAPLWRVNGIDWDANPIRSNSGNRLRQLAVVNLVQDTPLNLLVHSVAKRKKKPLITVGPWGHVNYPSWLHPS